jgi:glycosyltransferase involved in cell wall biosynthesis
MPNLAIASAPLVSVIMPVYNPHPVYFRQAVDSIRRQTLTEWELLIVEDPSPRPAAPLLADLNDPRIRHLVRSEKGTIVESLNWGLAESLAPIVARADADDVCEPDRLEKQLAYLNQHPEIDVMGTQLAIIDGDGNLRGYRRYPLDHGAILCGMTRYNALAHPSVVFKKERVAAAGGYRGFFNEDYELWGRLAGRQANFANHPEALVRYRVIPKGIRSAKVRDMLCGTLEVKRLHWRDRMGLAARLRMWAERGMLWLPPRLVLYLFMKTQFRPAPRAMIPVEGPNP